MEHSTINYAIRRSLDGSAGRCFGCWMQGFLHLSLISFSGRTSACICGLLSFLDPWVPKAVACCLFWMHGFSHLSPRVSFFRCPSFCICSPLYFSGEVKAYILSCFFFGTDTSLHLWPAVLFRGSWWPTAVACCLFGMHEFLHLWPLVLFREVRGLASVAHRLFLAWTSAMISNSLVSASCSICPSCF